MDVSMPPSMPPTEPNVEPEVVVDATQVMNDAPVHPCEIKASKSDLAMILQDIENHMKVYSEKVQTITQVMQQLNSLNLNNKAAEEQLMQHTQLYDEMKNNVRTTLENLKTSVLQFNI